MTLDALIAKLLELQPQHGREVVWCGDENQPWDWGRVEAAYAVPARPKTLGDPGYPAYVAVTWGVPKAEE